MTNVNIRHDAPESFKPAEQNAIVRQLSNPETREAGERAWSQFKSDNKIKDKTAE